MTELSSNDELFLRRAIALSHKAVSTGCRPFGAVLVDKRGNVVAEGHSTQQLDKDWTAHAEIKVIRESGRLLSWEELKESTLYSSSDPCPMCSGAIYWSNIRRLVYGMGEDAMRPLRKESLQGRGLVMSCREVLAKSPHDIEVIGPALEAEAAKAHLVFWNNPRGAEGWVK